MQIHPSILAADFARLADEIARVPAADAIHVDVMDNHFVPNLTFGHQMVRRLAEVSGTPIDVHLMIENSDYEAPRFAEMGVSSVTFHIESSASPLATIAQIRSNGAKAAVAIRPSTSIEAIKPLLASSDMVLVMTVEPGFGGQKLIPEMIDRVAELRLLTRDELPQLLIQVDGGVDESNIGALVAAGADVIVAGSSVFGNPNPNRAIIDLRATAQGLA